jgi:hypothetical protein
MRKSFIILAASAALASSANATVLFDSGGFESYTPGSLIGQNGFVLDGGTASQWQVQSAVAIGSKAVAVNGATTSWAFPSLNYTPAANELVSCAASIAGSDPAASAADAFGYLLDIYGSSGGRIARVGLGNYQNTLVVIATTRYNTTTSTFDYTGTLGNWIVSSALNANTFYDLEARLNFQTKTYDLYSGNTLVLGNLPWGSTSATPTDTGILDADLQLSGGAGSLTTGYFDNYIVQTMQIPEPASLSLLACAAPLFLRRRKA